MPGKNNKPALTAERLRELLDYDPKTGEMTWRVKRGGRVSPGSRAGSLNNRGYVLVEIDGRCYGRNRLAFLHMTGAWPLNEADHKNGIRDDDRWCNLRDATRSENARNRKCSSRHGVKGVSYFSRCKTRPWGAYIDARGGKRKHLGVFATKAEAAAARLDAERRLHGKFAVSKRRAEPKDRVSFADQRLGEQLFELSEIMIADSMSETTASAQ